jgi:hypothetical protein
VTIYYTKIPEEPVSERTPTFRNIVVSRMTVNRAPVVVSIEGLPEMPISGLRLMDIIGSGKAGLQAYNTSGMELHDLRIVPVSGPTFQIKTSKGLELDGLDGTVHLEESPGAIVRNAKPTAQ